MSKKNNLWFTRRGNQVRGPYPAGMIRRYILLGRILETDELSADQSNWKIVTSYPNLYPEELTLDLNEPENRERLRLARLREDERKFGDRRDRYDGAPDDPDEMRHKRTGIERRDDEPMEALRHREIKTEFTESLTRANQNERYYVRILLVATFLISVVALAATYAPKRGIAINNCNSDAAPYVNWSNCRIDGMKLTDEELTGAQFRNSSLTSADLSRSKLKGAEFSYANMSNASMSNADLSDAVLVGTTLRSANLSYTKLHGANLRYAILHNSILIGADLSNADLTHAMLNGAYMEGVNLEGAILDKAIWTDNTVCAPESVGKCIPLLPDKQ